MAGSIPVGPTLFTILKQKNVIRQHIVAGNSDNKRVGQPTFPNIRGVLPEVAPAMPRTKRRCNFTLNMHA